MMESGPFLCPECESNRQALREISDRVQELRSALARREDQLISATNEADALRALLRKFMMTDRIIDGFLTEEWEDLCDEARDHLAE